MISLATLGLLGLLGIRHGLDPDHVAVIDNITFRAMDNRPKAAPWTGTLFSVGHSVSVMVIALLFGLIGRQFAFPPLFARIMTWVVIALLLWIGAANVRALLSSGAYVAQGWRGGFLPGALRHSTHPFATLLTGAMFGLVIDTAAQIAAWGTAAAAAGGMASAALIGLAFAAGMVATDSADSLIVARLMRAGAGRARTYRRAIGWLIAALSFVMAGLAIVAQVRPLDLSDGQTVLAGAAMAAVVILGLVVAGRIKSLPDKI